MEAVPEMGARIRGSTLPRDRRQRQLRGERLGVEAAELVSTSDGAIHRVDVFLRPAAVLDAVHQAMVAAWPASGDAPSPRQWRP